MKPLREFSTDELLAELVRRRNGQLTVSPEHWCHDCGHYKSWDMVPRKPFPRVEMPDSFNPCTKGHAMQFVTPQEHDDEYGFYRRVCADRQPI